MQRTAGIVNAEGDASLPLCVDLDGTLLRTDTLVESVLVLLRVRPWMVVALIGWLLGGRAHFKQRVASAVQLDPVTLPYNEPLVAYLRVQRSLGRPVFLATAAPEATAHAIATHLGIFDAVHATSDVNLKGDAKAARLAAVYGEGGFAYAGDSSADLAVWCRAGAAVLVDVAPRVRRALPARLPVEAVFDRPEQRAITWLKALRPHQWIKNLLVLVPLLTAHRYDDPSAVMAAANATLAMCLLASATYIVNDLFDLDADRAHPSKRFRPFASGALPLTWGLAMAPLLVAGAALLASHLSLAFGAGLLTYAIATTAYTLRVKHMAWLDALWLAGLYALRILLGAFAIGVPESWWLLCFSLCAFLSLALLKRYAELDAGDPALPARRVRGYTMQQTRAVALLGQAAAVASILILALYVRSGTVEALYREPRWLWATVPLAAYLLARAWYEALRGRMHEDPVVYALRRADTYGMGALLVCVVLVAR